MFTVCSKCDLRLVVTAADLRAAQGYVRCGRCHNVFNALAALSDELPDPAASTQSPALSPPPPAALDAPAALPDSPAAADSAAASYAPADAPANPFEFNAARTDLDDVFVAAQSDIDATGTFESIILVGEDLALQPAPLPPAPPPAAAAMTGVHPAAQPLLAPDPASPPSQAPQAIHEDRQDREDVREQERQQLPDEAREALVATGNSEALSALDMPEALDAAGLAMSTTFATVRADALDLPPAPTAAQAATEATELPRHAAVHDAAPATQAAAAEVDTLPAFDWAAPAALDTAATPAAHADVPDAAATPAAPLRPEEIAGAGASDLQQDARGPGAAGGEPPPWAAALEAVRALETVPATQAAAAEPDLAPAAPAPRRSGLLYAAAALLILALLGQVAHHYRGALAAIGPLQQPLTRLYAGLDVPLYPRWQISQYEVHQLGAVAGAQNPGDLIVRASIKNTAARAQPLPLLRVVVQDRFGNRVAARDVRPAEYLPRAQLAPTLMQPGQQVLAQADFVDPGPTVVGFEIDACLMQPIATVVCANDPGGH